MGMLLAVMMVRLTRSRVIQRMALMAAHQLVQATQHTTPMVAHQPALGIQHTILTEHLIPAQEILLMALMVQTVHVMVIQPIVIKNLAISLSKLITLLSGFVLLAMLTGCANHYTPEAFAHPYGFFSGIWHGFIFEFSLIGYLIFDNVYIIGEPNTGFFYYIGFILGLFKVGFVGR